MSMVSNKSHEPPLAVFGLIFLPKKYKVEVDVVMGLIGVMSLLSVIANAILLLAIIKDPFKQLRTITATLLAYNSVTNTIISVVLLLDNVLYWKKWQFAPELVAYLNACGSCLYLIGNFLHSVNVYGTIVVPVRYNCWVPKFRKILLQFLILISILMICVVMIPPYLLPKARRATYVKGIITFVCVAFALLVVIFGILYTRIFQTLYARKQRLAVSFHIKRSTPQGMAVMKTNFEVAKTLFMHVLFYITLISPQTIIIMVNLHCSTCCEKNKLQLAALFTSPCVYTIFVCHPLLWLFRLNSYRSAMKESLSFRRSKSQSSNNTMEETRPRLRTASTEHTNIRSKSQSFNNTTEETRPRSRTASTIL